MKTKEKTAKSSLPSGVQMQIAILKATLKGNKKLQIIIISALYCLIMGAVITIKGLINLIALLF